MGKPYFHMFRHTGLLIKGFIWTFIFIMLLSLSGLGQKWREFKIKARRNSWAVEHRNQFPVPPAESDEEDEDTSWLPNIMYGVPCWYEDTTTKPWMNLQSGARRSETLGKNRVRELTSFGDLLLRNLAPLDFTFKGIKLFSLQNSTLPNAVQ